MNKITNEAKRLKKHNSQLNQCLNTILKYVSIFILPIGGLLFLKQLIYSEQGFNDAIVSTVAAVFRNDSRRPCIIDQCGIDT